jgi:energy-coupling factor transporter ATP-binding protein EcfA2
LGNVIIAPRPGVTVLYGLNGVGKTRLLQGIADVLQGTGKGWIELDRTALDGSGIMLSLSYALGLSFAGGPPPYEPGSGRGFYFSELGSWSEDQNREADDTGEALSLTQELANWLCHQTSVTDQQIEDEQLAIELLSGDRLLMIPRGNGAFGVWLLPEISESRTPHLRRELELLQMELEARSANENMEVARQSIFSNLKSRDVVFVGENEDFRDTSFFLCEDTATLRERVRRMLRADCCRLPVPIAVVRSPQPGDGFSPVMSVIPLGLYRQRDVRSTEGVILLRQDLPSEEELSVGSASEVLEIRLKRIAARAAYYTEQANSFLLAAFSDDLSVECYPVEMTVRFEGTAPFPGSRHAIKNTEAKLGFRMPVLRDSSTRIGSAPEGQVGEEHEQENGSPHVPGTEWIAHNRLGYSERRWVTFAAQAAEVFADAEWRVEVDERFEELWEQSGALPFIMMIDEPERGLHRSAVRRVVENLSRIGRVPNRWVIVATHAAEFVNEPDTELVHITRGESGQILANVASIKQKARPVALGVEPAELLMDTRAFVVVEGTHDQVVIDELIGPELERLAVRTLCLRGAKNLVPIIDSELLFYYTAAPIIVVLDGLLHDEIGTRWARIVKEWQAGRRREARRLLGTLGASGQGEGRWLRSFGTRALEAGRLDRCWVFGMGKPDVVEFLPVEMFRAPDARVVGSWEELRAAYAHGGRRGDAGTGLKGWLKERGYVINERRVREAARSLDSIPDAFVRLLELVKEVAAMARGVERGRVGAGGPS